METEWTTTGRQSQMSSQLKIQDASTSSILTCIPQLLQPTAHLLGRTHNTSLVFDIFGDIFVSLGMTSKQLGVLSWIWGTIFLQSCKNESKNSYCTNMGMSSLLTFEQSTLKFRWPDWLAIFPRDLASLTTVQHLLKKRWLLICIQTWKATH